jgi:hypothetical protein
MYSLRSIIPARFVLKDDGTERVFVCQPFAVCVPGKTVRKRLAIALYLSLHRSEAPPGKCLSQRMPLLVISPIGFLQMIDCDRPAVVYSRHLYYPISIWVTFVISSHSFSQSIDLRRLAQGMRPSERSPLFRWIPQPRQKGAGSSHPLSGNARFRCSPCRCQIYTLQA